MGAVGFSIGTKGYFGTGSIGSWVNDFYEWDQASNTWNQKANFGGTTRYVAVGFSIGTKDTLERDMMAPLNRISGSGVVLCGLTVSINPTNVSCNGAGNGSATASVSGGASPYTYSWNTSPVQAGPTATGLIPNNYVVTVTDANSLTGTASVTITQPTILSVTSFANTTICSGGNVTFNGTTATGGTPNYNYSWSPVTNLSCTTCASPIATPTANVNYTVTATDANSCTAVKSVSVTVSPAPSAPTAGSNSPVSAGNTLSLTATTIASATYNWSGPGFSSASQNPTLASVTTANAGNYSVTATVNGCTSPAGTTSVSVTTFQLLQARPVYPATEAMTEPQL